MKRALIVLGMAVLAVAATQAAAFASAGFHSVTAQTSGQALMISFTESGLQAGQNYAYSASGTYAETFQCYKDRTFTPTHRTTVVTGDADPDPRAYTANANGRVSGFVNLWPNFPPPDFCPPRQSSVAVHICYQPRDLVDFVYYFPDGTTICGDIEPD
jgi:hypothetical protein